jgi:hypothetical protein
MMNGNNPNTSTVAEVQGNINAPGGILCRIFCWCDGGNSGGDFIQFTNRMEA